MAKAAGHKVIIIAHSMGGLITEKASTLGPTGANGAPTDIAAVFTLGTPYRGSWLASAAVGQGPDPTMNRIGQSLGALCPVQSGGTGPLPSNPSVKSHKKTPGLIDKAAAAACHLVKVNERNDPGVVAMRLKPGPQTMLPSPPANLPWYRLAASLQGELRPVWPLKISESLNDVGDGVVSTPSQLNGQPGTAQTTQICTVTGTAGHGRSARPVPRQPSFFDALNSACFHIREPDSKTLLDDIIGIIRAKHMIPTAPTATPLALGHLVGTWQNTNPSTRGTVRFVLSQGANGLEVHGFGSCSPAPCDWGVIPGQAYAADVQSTQAVAFTAKYNFGFSRDIIAGYLSGSVLTVGHWTTFTDNSGRSNYFDLETFTKAPGANAPPTKASPAGTSLAGTWQNTSPSARGTVRFVLSQGANGLEVHGFGSCSPAPCDWGVIPGQAYAADVQSTQAVAFTAKYNFGFSRDIIAGYLSGSVLTVGHWTTFTDNSGRSNYFDLETFTNGTGAPAKGAPTNQGVQITQVKTYQKGALVYFSIRYYDPDNDAEGFGFVGVNGSGWAEETHPFSSPSYGIVGPDRIDYPFNLGCGTPQQVSQSDVKAWIYDAAGLRSKSVVIQLSCTGNAG